MASSDRNTWIGPLATGLAGLVAGAVLATAGQSSDTKTVTTVVTSTTTIQSPVAAPAPTPTTSTEPTAPAQPAAQARSTQPRVRGALGHDCGIIGGCTSPDAAGELTSDGVWCQWRHGRVTVHAVLSNGMNARVHLSIVPKYFIEKGGQHGTSFGSDIAVVLKPHETRNWTGDAGHPEGVPSGTPISACEPHLEDIDIG